MFYHGPLELMGHCHVFVVFRIACLCGCVCVHVRVCIRGCTCIVSHQKSAPGFYLDDKQNRRDLSAGEQIEKRKKKKKEREMDGRIF